MDGISNWAAMSLVTSGGNSYNGSSGFKIGADAADLIWEKANQVNVGINAELFNGRLALSVDGYYQKRQADYFIISVLLLQQDILPGQPISARWRTKDWK